MSSTCPDEDDLQTNYSLGASGERVHFGFSKCAAQSYPVFMLLVSIADVVDVPPDGRREATTCRGSARLESRNTLLNGLDRQSLSGRRNEVHMRTARVRRRAWISRCGLLAAFTLTSAACLSPRAGAQTNAATASPGNRWLLVVETSRAMRPRAGAAQELASMLVYSGMNGQARPGDTIGLWTYNERLLAGQFALQEWQPASNKEIARHVYEFLGMQKFEKEGRLDAVLPDLQHLVKASKFISIFLISDGQQEIHGTPFDEKINATYRAWRAEQEKAKLPFVTLLRAKAGRITDYVVDMPPWPLKLPPLPTELESRKVAPPKPEKPAPRVLPPLILSGRKTESAPDTRPAESSPTNTSSSIETPAPPVHSNGPAAPHESVSPLAAPGVVREPKGSANEVSVLPTEPAAASPAEGTEHTVRAPASDTATTTQQTQGLVEHSSQPAGVQTAVTLPPESFWSRKSTWISACGVLALVFVCAFFLVRRSRSGSGTSLITRSLEREHKGK